LIGVLFMKTRCPHCQKMIETSADTNGMEVECPVCKQNFTVSPVLTVAENNTKKTVFLIVLIALLVAGIVGGSVYYLTAKETEKTEKSSKSKESKETEKSGSKKTSKKSTFTNAANETFTLPNGVKLEMVKVEPGSFTMSKRDGENFGSEVEHSKALTKAFYIGKYEVTQAQYEAVMGNNPSYFKGSNRPVEQVCWYEAMSFCEKMNQYAPKGWKFTLPTETQWEFAARGGNRSKGYKYSGSNNLDDVGWYDSNSGDTTHEVGGKTPNELGLYDTSGNVNEWCLDNWQSNSDETCAEFYRPYHDEDGSYRVFRGGGWRSLAEFCRSALRSGWSPGSRNSYIGFRLALVPVQ